MDELMVYHMQERRVRPVRTIDEVPLTNVRITGGSDQYGQFRTIEALCGGDKYSGRMYVSDVGFGSVVELIDEQLVSMVKREILRRNPDLLYEINSSEPDLHVSTVYYSVPQRDLRASWSAEAEQDLRAFYNIDIIDAIFDTTYDNPYYWDKKHEPNKKVNWAKEGF